MPELLEKDAKKNHIEYGRYLEFLIRKHSIKVRYLDRPPIKQRKQNWIKKR
jgi:hypothetical protein